MAEVEAPSRRRSGAATRQEAIRVALALFTEQGYEATSLRQIADALGINKASLYYHFPSKEAILQAGFDRRGSEADDLVAWCEQQPRTPDLLERAVLRWVDSFSADKLQGLRFLRANPFIARVISEEEGSRIADPLGRLSDLLTGLLPDPTSRDVVLVRMAVLSINAAVEAGVGTGASDEEVVAAAHASAAALIRLVA